MSVSVTHLEVAGYLLCRDEHACIVNSSVGREMLWSVTCEACLAIEAATPDEDKLIGEDIP